jgi:hypothetical protein
MDLLPGEGETEYLIDLLMGGYGAGKDKSEPLSAAPNVRSHQTGGKGAAEERNQTQREIQGDQLSRSMWSKKGHPKYVGRMTGRPPRGSRPRVAQGLELETSAQGITGAP